MHLIHQCKGKVCQKLQICLSPKDRTATFSACHGSKRVDGRFFDKYVEQLPNKNIFHLLDSYRKDEVFTEYKAEQEKAGLPSVAHSYFYKLWNRHFGTIKIPASNRFSVCTTCSELKAAIKKEQDDTEIERWKIRLKTHREQQAIEREKLTKHRVKCHGQPMLYLGIAIDGMNQKKTELPHIRRPPKDCENASMINVHVVGCLVFNRAVESRVYLNYANIHNDGNLTIAIIQDVINNWEGRLPDNLYVQMDNTARENKNTLVMAYLNMLVAKGICREEPCRRQKASAKQA